MEWAAAGRLLPGFQALWKTGRAWGVVTLSSKAQLVIPKRFRRLLGLGPGSRLAVRLREEGLELRLQASGTTASSREVIGCTGHQGTALPIEGMDPARFAVRV
jgi:AbrB family looped-hinge helix DNA binding protein